jgi:hypothetical protein
LCPAGSIDITLFVAKIGERLSLEAAERKRQDEAEAAERKRQDEAEAAKRKRQDEAEAAKRKRQGDKLSAQFKLQEARRRHQDEMDALRYELLKNKIAREIAERKLEVQALKSNAGAPELDQLVKEK